MAHMAGEWSALSLRSGGYIVDDNIAALIGSYRHCTHGSQGSRRELHSKAYSHLAPPAGEPTRKASPYAGIC